MDANDLTAVKNVVATLVESGAKRATKFLSDRRVVRATRKSYRKGSGADNVEITLTIGRPNYSEREFVKRCKEAGEPFPVRNIQLQPRRR